MVPEKLNSIQIQSQSDFNEEIDASKPRTEFDDKKCDTVISNDLCSKETGTPADTLEEIADAEPESSDSAAENREQESTTESSKADVDKSFIAQLPSTGHSGKATGPRTAQGKQNSSVNATKHGIFSHATVLKGESKTEYENLLSSLRDHFLPEGALEDLLVEKIAALQWRYRRLLYAERGEIEAKAISVELTPAAGLQSIIARIKAHTIPLGAGLIEDMADPVTLHRCLVLLEVLRGGIEDVGFQTERDEKILSEIYGRPDNYSMSKTLYDTYVGWANKSRASQKKRDKKTHGENVLGAIDKEITRLEQFRDTRAALEAERIRFAKLRRTIPKSDRLLRYEASLDRSFDRTLNQLERVQRMRKGQFLPPPLNLQIS